MFDKKNNIKEMSYKEALKENYKNIYVQDKKGYLVLGWKKKNLLGWIMYYLFSPFYLWKHARISSIIIVYLWVVLIGEFDNPQCQQGLHCNYDYIGIYALLILLFSARPKTKITKSSLKATSNNQIIFDGENIIISREELQQKIKSTGIVKFLEHQKEKIQSDIKEENERKIKEENERLENEKNSLISKIDKKYPSTIKSKKQSFDVVSSKNWGVNPRQATFNWKVSDVALLDIKEQLKHCVKMDQVDHLKEKMGIFGEKDYAVLNDNSSIKVKVDDMEFGISDIKLINADTHKVITRAADEKVSYVTRSVGMDNILDTKFKASISKTDKVVKKIKEESHVRLVVNLTLSDGKSCSLQSEYYTNSYKDLLKLIEYIKNTR